MDKEVKKEVGFLGPIFTQTKTETRTRGTMKRKSLAEYDVIEEHADMFLHFPSTSSSPIALKFSSLKRKLRRKKEEEEEDKEPDQGRDFLKRIYLLFCFRF